MLRKAFRENLLNLRKIVEKMAERIECERIAGVCAWLAGVFRKSLFMVE